MIIVTSRQPLDFNFSAFETALLKSLLDDDKLTHVAEQKIGTPATTENTYSISGSTLSFNTSTFAEDGYVACYYFVDQVAKSFVIDNVSFPGGYRIYGDTALKGTDQADNFVQFKLHNVKPQSNATLTMDVDNICTLEINQIVA